MNAFNLFAHRALAGLGAAAITGFLLVASFSTAPQGQLIAGIVA
ncbi:hypothetical protein [Altericroceibacterium spongiae]|nr:hypothetical protein [Altericroceibacterium spongiae]